jgi:hypothetical protein
MPEFAGISPQGYSSQHFVNFKTADGFISYTLTGIVLITFQGAATGSDFLRKPLTFEVPIPDLPPRKGLKLRHWAPFVTLGSISNDGSGSTPGAKVAVAVHSGASCAPCRGPRPFAGRPVGGAVVPGDPGDATSSRLVVTSCCDEGPC